MFPLQDKYVNLLTDFGFKRVFGTEPNKRLLIDFLNTLLPPERQIADLTFKNNENVGNTPVDRKAIFDIYCQGETGDRFIVELQKAKQNFFKDRSVFYSTFPIQEQAQKGNWDFKLAPVYAVGVLDFVFDDHKDSETIIHTVELKDQDCAVFYDKLKFIYIELPKFKKTLDQLESRGDKWLYLLRHIADLTDRPEPLQEGVFNELFDVAEIANFSVAEQDRYQSSLKYYRDLNNVVDTARGEGVIRGREEGLQQGREEGLQEGLAQGREEGLQEGLAQGREEGRLEAARSLILSFLTRQIGAVPELEEQALGGLSAEGLDDLGRALLGFETVADLRIWLQQNAQGEAVG